MTTEHAATENARQHFGLHTTQPVDPYDVPPSDPRPGPVTQREPVFGRGIVWADIVAEIERDQALRETRGRKFSEMPEAA